LAGKCPVSPALEGGVKGHNIKGKYFIGKPHPIGRGASLRSCEKIKNVQKKRACPVRTVLLENFGSEPLAVQFNGLKGNHFVPLLPRNVARNRMLHIPKVRKESHPERGKRK
jgi:hypothetical protein